MAPFSQEPSLKTINDRLNALRQNSILAQEVPQEPVMTSSRLRSEATKSLTNSPIMPRSYGGSLMQKDREEHSFVADGKTRCLSESPLPLLKFLTYSILNPHNSFPKKATQFFLTGKTFKISCWIFPQLTTFWNLNSAPRYKASKLQRIFQISTKRRVENQNCSDRRHSGDWRAWIITIIVQNRFMGVFLRLFIFWKSFKKI